MRKLAGFGSTNFLITIFAIFVSVLFLAPPATAQDKKGDSDVPPDLWESHEGTIDFAMGLITLDGGPPSTPPNTKESAIRMYVKNTSKSVQALIWSSDTDQGTGFRIYSIEATGAKHLLHDREPPPLKKDPTAKEVAEWRLRMMVAHSGSAGMTDIAPGETTTRLIVLTPADLALIKARPVQCVFSVINPQTSRELGITSSPRILTEISPK